MSDAPRALGVSNVSSKYGHNSPNDEKRGTSRVMGREAILASLLLNDQYIKSSTVAEQAYNYFHKYTVEFI